MLKNKFMLIITLLLLPIQAYASEADQSLPLTGAIFMEAFVSIHMSAFVLSPLSKIISKENPKKVFWILFVIRVAILLFFDFFVTTQIAIFDFFAVFVGAFLLIPFTIMTKIKQKTILMNAKPILQQENVVNKSQSLKCEKCGGALESTDNFCINCGTRTNRTTTFGTSKMVVTPADFDSIYSLPEEQMIEEFLNRELLKANIDKNANQLPESLLKRKKILNIFFSALIFIFISLVFFHFPIYTYVVGLIILIITFKLTRGYDLTQYLKKQIKERPSEKISNIVMHTKESLVKDNSRKLFAISLLIAFILPLIIFYEPRILYEKVDGGYAVRYYTFGLTNYTTVSIPETYKNEKVVSLRGNAFSNMPYLTTVKLPDTITEIRGQAFMNDKSLKEVNIPLNLEYLGGGAFYNCTSITSITLPNTLTYLGGEAFYNATSLKEIKLSNNIDEIRGSTFENCVSLKAIEIPDKVTRIGGHAFYGCKALKEVKFTKNSYLKEIGSSAFRRCYNLRSITLPKNVSVNFRAFKESPTQINYFNNQ